MSIQKLRTVFSTGTWINNVKTYFTKINEIIDYLNGTTGAGSYKKWVALVTQTTTNDPDLTVLENTTGQSFDFSRTNTGLYEASGVYNTSKTGVFVGTLNGNYHCVTVISSNNLVIGTRDSSSVPSDDVLNNTLIEIRLYNE